MGTGQWAGSPQAQKEGTIFSSSSTLQSLSSASLRSQLFSNETEPAWF